eukprot:scaffold1156_cov48-Cyclotella_meneghiniana.AAC.3
MGQKDFKREKRQVKRKLHEKVLGESTSSYALVKLLAMHCVLENRPLTICRRIFVHLPGDNPICVRLKGKLVYVACGVFDVLTDRTG